MAIAKDLSARELQKFEETTGGEVAVRTIGLKKYQAGYFAVADTSFVVGDSPATIDINAALSRNADVGYVTCDGLGNIIINLSENGSTYGNNITLKDGESFSFEGMNVDSVKITHSGADSAYRVFAR